MTTVRSLGLFLADPLNVPNRGVPGGQVDRRLPGALRPVDDDRAAWEGGARGEKVRQHPRLAPASAKLAAAVEVLLEATTRDEAVAIADLWALIESGASAEAAPVLAAMRRLLPVR
jgi:hypothetical protein